MLVAFNWDVMMLQKHVQSETLITCSRFKLVRLTPESYHT